MERLGIGGRLLRERRLKMWTQGDLAGEAGVSPTTVSGIENGRISSPHFGTVRKLARALGVDPGALLSSGGPSLQGLHAPLSLGWARSTREEEFEQGIEEARLEELKEFRRDLDEERARLQALYGEAKGTEERRYIKWRIRAVSAQSGSVTTSMMFRDEDAGRADTGEASSWEG